jgi:hypothetical protein
LGSDPLRVCNRHAPSRRTSTAVSRYLDRYAEPDKGWVDRAESRWPAPYWYIDTGMAALLMLLTALDQLVHRGHWGGRRQVTTITCDFVAELPALSVTVTRTRKVPARW